MLPRHAYLSATMLALAATMAEEDSPVVPSPDDLDAPPDLWSTPLGRAGVDDMQADEERRWTVTDTAMIESALKGEPAPSLYEPLRTGYTEIDAAISGTFGDSLSRGSDRHEQRRHKKARGKRKAKKGWA